MFTLNVMGESIELNYDYKKLFMSIQGYQATSLLIVSSFVIHREPPYNIQCTWHGASPVLGQTSNSYLSILNHLRRDWVEVTRRRVKLKFPGSLEVK